MLEDMKSIGKPAIGFKLDKLFDLASHVKEKAKSGDKLAKALLDSASKRWGRP